MTFSSVLAFRQSVRGRTAVENEYLVSVEHTPGYSQGCAREKLASHHQSGPFRAHFDEKDEKGAADWQITENS